MSAKTQRITLSYILLVALLCVMLASYVPAVGIAYAEDKVYSNVLDDLKKDTTFDESMYPEIADNYTLSIITVAESEDKELFVYVYQPSGQKKNLRASSINISLTAKEDITPTNYMLEYINSNGVFFKYKVKGITVSNAEARYYGIIQIMRPFDESLGDEQASGDNTVDEVPFEIAKQYRFFIINGKKSVSVCDIETIKITNKFVGFVRYPDGFIFNRDSCDSHFVAFSTDKPMDHLMEVELQWTQQAFTHQPNAPGHEFIYGEVDEPQKRTISEDDETVKYHGDGWFAGTYEWERIETVDEFIKNTNSYTNVYAGALLNVNMATPIKEDQKANFEGMQWVLRFTETKYDDVLVEHVIWPAGQNYYEHVYKSTLVGDVIILRLKFKTDGVVYNLGVVDNKQTGSGEPINNWENPDIKAEPTKFSKWFALAICIVLLIVLIILLAPILPYIFKAVIWIISLPFKAIGAIVKACKKDKDKDKAVEVPLGNKVIEGVKTSDKTKTKTKAKRHRSRKNE